MLHQFYKWWLELLLWLVIRWTASWAPYHYIVAASLGGLLIGSPWNSQAVVYLFQKTFTLLGEHSISVTADILGTDRKYFMVHAHFTVLSACLFKTWWGMKSLLYTFRCPGVCQPLLVINTIYHSLTTTDSFWSTKGGHSCDFYVIRNFLPPVITPHRFCIRVYSVKVNF